MAKKALAQDVRNNYFFVDSRRLIVEEGFNQRENYGDIPGMAKSILAQGLHKLNPLKCYKQGEYYVIIRGHRRNAAIKILEQQTDEILMVPIFLEKKGASMESRYFEQATENDQMPFSPWEKAKVLRKMLSFGWDERKMAEESGWTLVYVRRLLSLLEAPQKFIDLIREGIISGTFAMDVIAKGEIEAVLKKADENQLSPPMTDPELFSAVPPRPVDKITKADIKPNSWKIFKKWVPEVDEKELSPEKADFLKWLKKMLEGELTEKDFKKFFR